MTRALVVFDTADRDLGSILLAEAKKGKEGWAYAHLHPRMLALMLKIEHIGYGSLNITIRDGLPELGRAEYLERF